MNRLVKAASKVQVDPEAIEKLKIVRDDFMYALEHDIKPAFGHAAEQIEQYLRYGIINWGEPVTRILEDGDLLTQQAKSEDSRGLVSVLLEGHANSGKTALAAKIAMNSDFPFMKICSPEDMVGYTETAKCAMIRKVFDDAYKSPLSVVLVDNVERLLDYSAVGQRYSNLVLQALMVLLKKQPPPKRKLLVLATSSMEKSMLQEMGLLDCFSTKLHVSNLILPEHVMQVLDNVDVKFSPHELQQFQRILSGKTCCIGIKKLLDIVDLVRQTDPTYRALKFDERMTEEGGLSLPEAGMNPFLHAAK